MGEKRSIILNGPIDTQEEVKKILDFLSFQGDLHAFHLQGTVTPALIQKFLLVLKNRRLEGPIDTPGEIKFLLKLLREDNLLLGPIDTPEEVEIFMRKLREEGILVDSLSAIAPIVKDPSAKPNVKDKFKP